MLRIIIILYCMGYMPYTCLAQNLVPNSSFEDMDICPTENGQVRWPLNIATYPVQSVSNWIAALNSSPDYYNGCSPSNDVSVPNNYLGYHPARTGQAYVGIIPYSSIMSDPPSYFAEHVEVRLLAPLLADSFYEISCYVKPVPKPNPISVAIMAVNALGAVFTDTTLLGYNAPLDAMPVKLVAPGNAILNDTTKWVKLTGHYKARGGERWLTLGGHFTGFTPVLTHLNSKPPGAITHYHTYYLVDDVSVSAHPACDTFIALHDTNLCMPQSLPAKLTSPAPDTFAFRWNTADTTATITITGEGTYTCIATDGCTTYIDTYRVRTSIDTFRNKPFRGVYFCEGGEHTLTPTFISDAYWWNTGETTRSIIVRQPGIYSCYTRLSECLV